MAAESSLISINYTSILDKNWAEQPIDPRKLQHLMQKTGLPEIIARIISAREIAVNEIEDFLTPTIRNTLPDPFHLKDMDKGAQRIVDAILQGETIAIFGDYDVDGATSSALLARFFAALGASYLVYIPDRVKEGYGPNIKALMELKSKGASVIITVDCGTTANLVLNEASTNGIDVIVIDHHQSSTELPKICALINPNRIDETSEYRYLAAVGVTFLVTVAVNIMLKKANFITYKLPDLLGMLDIVALGTVCDVVPLRGLNRTFVVQGLKVLAKKGNIGLSFLSEVAKLNGEPNCYHLGYLLGPRINAGGRVGKSDLGVKLLTTNDEYEAIRIAKQLDEYNNERKSIEIDILDQAMRQAEEKSTSNQVLVIIGENWHQGVIGIIASRVKEKFNMPCAIVTLMGEMGKASCRSVKGFDFGRAVTNAKLESILHEGGGHAMAAGFTIARDKISLLQSYLNSKFAESQEFMDPHISHFSAIIAIDGITSHLAKLIESVGPFGSESPEPRFMIKNIFIHKLDIFASQHARLLIGNSHLKVGKMLVATAFRITDSKIGEILLSGKKGNFHVIGYLRMNYWNGNEKVDFVIDDLIEG